LIGPIYGSVALVGLRTVLGSWTEHYHMIIGALFMLAVIFMPRGIAGLFERKESGPAQDEAERT